MGTTETLKKYTEKVSRDQLFTSDVNGDALQIEDVTLGNKEGEGDQWMGADDDYKLLELADDE